MSTAFWVGLIIGLIVGSFVGLGIAALMVTASDRDTERERLFAERVLRQGCYAGEDAKGISSASIPVGGATSCWNATGGAEAERHD